MMKMLIFVLQKGIFRLDIYKFLYLSYIIVEQQPNKEQETNKCIWSDDDILEKKGKKDMQGFSLILMYSMLPIDMCGS